MSLTPFVMLLWLIFVIYIRHRIKPKPKWNPFASWKMTTLIRRKDGSTFERPFKRLEYTYQEIDEGTIIGIYFIRTKPKTKKQIKYEELCKKWR